MPVQYVEVKYLEPEQHKGFGEFKLDGLYDHPTRWRFVDCWIDRLYDNNISMIGGQGAFCFTNGHCPDFLGQHEAYITGEISLEIAQTNRQDRFLLA